MKSDFLFRSYQHNEVYFYYYKTFAVTQKLKILQNLPISIMFYPIKNNQFYKIYIVNKSVIIRYRKHKELKLAKIEVNLDLSDIKKVAFNYIG